MKPNYMTIGSAKSATSTLCTLLGQHPDVFVTQPKEPNFFSNDEIYDRGFEWYESLYESAGTQKMRGEGSNRYTMKEVFPKTVSRLASYNPDLKFIYIVRNPIDRIESYWIQKRSHGGEEVHYNFNTAVRINRDWLVDSSNYWQQISAYRSKFSDKQILVVFYEDFKNDSQAFLESCFEFLEVDPKVPLLKSNVNINPSSEKRLPTKKLSQLRSLSLFRFTAKLIPSTIREPLKQKFFLKKVESRPQWQTDVQNWVADILESDTRQFLEFYGKPRDFWNLRSAKTLDAKK